MKQEPREKKILRKPQQKQRKAQPIPEKRQITIPSDQEVSRSMQLGEYVTIHGLLYQVTKILKRKIVLSPSKRTITKRF